MKNNISFPMLIVTIVLVATPIVFAGVGSLRIEPQLPIKSTSPADFEIWAESGTAYFPHIFLVIPESCFLGLTGDTVVSWTGASSPLTIEISDWIGPEDNNNLSLPSSASPGYNVATLQAHIPTSDPIYYVFEPILEGPLTSTKETITVELHSSEPEMLVYVLGKQTEESNYYDIRVPPTIPGFVIPEIPLGTLMGLASMMAALIIMIKRPSLSIKT